MALLASILACLAFAGAIASWAAGAWFHSQWLASSAAEHRRTRLAWLALLTWPFASRPADGAAATHASKINKALVAFFTCMMVAAAATSLATNLARVSR